MNAQSRRAHKRATRLSRAQAAAGAAVGVFAIAPHAAQAQLGAAGNTTPAAPLTFKSNYLGYAASVSPRVAYSDNLQLLPEGGEDGAVIGSVVLNGSGIYSTNRFTGLISGDLDLSYLGGDQNTFVVNQRIGGAGTATIAENIAYFDVAGSSTRQLVGDNARFSQNLNAARNQQVNVHSITLSPYFNRELKNGALAEVRYRFSQVFIDENENNAFQGFLNDSRTQEVQATYNTGQSIERLKLGASVYGARTNESGALFAPEFEVEQGTVVGDAQYSVTERFALTGTVGFDEISSDAPEQFIPDDELSGVFWRGGVRLKPGRKTDLLFEYGERYGDDYFSGSINYAISPRLRFNARADRLFLTRAQAVNSQFLLNQRGVLDFASDLREGSALSPEGVIQSSNNLNQGVQFQTLGIGASNVVSAGLVGAYDRTQLSVNFIYQDDDFGFRQIQTIGGDVGINHQLSRRLSAYGSLFYRFADTSVDFNQCVENPALFGIDPNNPLFNPVLTCAGFVAQNGETDTVGGRIGARYQFYKNVSVFGEYSRTQRFGDTALLRFKENFVQAGLTLTF